MKIAFDVKGTIEGSKQKIVLKVLKEFQARGHEIIVWSSVYSYAVEAVKKHNLKADIQSKNDKWSTDEEYYMDIAIDDDTESTYLAAKKFVWVSELPDWLHDVSKFVDKLEQEIEEKQKWLKIKR